MICEVEEDDGIPGCQEIFTSYWVFCEDYGAAEGLIRAVAFGGEVLCVVREADWDGCKHGHC